MACLSLSPTLRLSSIIRRELGLGTYLSTTAQYGRDSESTMYEEREGWCDRKNVGDNAFCDRNATPRDDLHSIHLPSRPNI